MEMHEERLSTMCSSIVSRDRGGSNGRYSPEKNDNHDQEGASHRGREKAGGGQRRTSSSLKVGSIFNASIAF